MKETAHRHWIIHPQALSAVCKRTHAQKHEYDKRSTTLEFAALWVSLIKHSYQQSFCTAAPLVDTSPSHPHSINADMLNGMRKLQHLGESENNGSQVWESNKHAAANGAPQAVAHYLWAHCQRAVSQSWQSNWCLEMQVKEPRGPPLGHGVVGVLAYTCFMSKHTTDPFVWGLLIIPF